MLSDGLERAAPVPDGAITARSPSRRRRPDFSVAVFAAVGILLGVLVMMPLAWLAYFALTDAATRTITATAAAALTTNDIVVKILGPTGEVLATSDSATSPEVATYTAASIPAGTYAMQVCPYPDPTVPFVAPGTYAVAQ